MITRTDVRNKIDDLKSNHENVYQGISDWLCNEDVPQDEIDKILDDLKSYDNY